MSVIIHVVSGGTSNDVTFPPNCKAETVESTLNRAYGPGLLMQGGVGVLIKTLSAGHYEYEVTFPGKLSFNCKHFIRVQC